MEMEICRAVAAGRIRRNNTIMYIQRRKDRERRESLAEKLKHSTDETEFTDAELKLIADTLGKIWKDGEDDSDFIKWLEDEEKDQDEGGN